MIDAIILTTFNSNKEVFNYLADNYSSGNKRNHIFNKRISYLNRDISDVKKILQAKKSKSVSYFSYLASAARSICLFLDHNIQFCD